MKVYEAGVAGGRRGNGAVRVAVEANDSGLYRLRSAADVALHGQSAYRRQETVWTRLAGAAAAVGRLFLPVLLLLSALAAMYLYLDTKAPFQIGASEGAGSWLTVSHLILPVAFFLVALTNRRYGPAYALAQVMITCALAAGAVFFAGDTLRATLPAAIQPEPRLIGAFAGAFVAANFIAILVFDGARGPRWWWAPLLSLISASLVFCGIFGPAAYAGVPGPWLTLMLDYLAVMAGASIVLLVPYWMLRGFVPPLSGFGGY